MYKMRFMGAAIGIALLTAGALYPRAKPVAQNTLPLPLMKADSFIEGIDMEAFAPNGHLSWHMTATDSMHTHTSSSTIMHQPYFVVYEANGKDIHWQVKSLEATAYHQDKMRTVHHIDLASNVELKLLPGGKDGMTLHTDMATFTPHTATLETEAPIQIESPRGNIAGTGLTANLKSSKMNIHKGVKGTYGTKH